VGFAADAGERGLERAREKLANKRGNLFVYNDVSQPGVGFEAEENALVLVSDRGEKQIGRRSKEECAVAILDEVEGLLGGG
jgi:phosphopantothenoylcysteine decarboxylase/phosphopantothenate--cysteine ligase